MSTTLPHGIIQINEGNISWYGDITANWQLIDSKIGEYDAAVASIPAPANTGTLTINYGGTTIAMFGADDAGNVTADIPAAGDGTLTITQGGSTLGTFSANQATSETIDLPALGDGTLTITVNGATAGTFSANQSTAATANITVPTKTSDLTNDSGFITEDNTKIPLAGSNAISGSLIPATTDAYDLGGPSYQWNNAYIKSLTINGVAAGDILTHNASEFVNVSSNQAIDGQKIFSNNQTGVGRDLYHFASNPYSKNTPPANTSFQYIWFGGNTASQGFTNSWYGGFIEHVMDSDGSVRGSWVIRNTSENRMGIQLSESADGSSSSIIPIASIDLGTSTNKWKDVNTVLLNGKTPAYSTDIPTKVSQLTNDSGFITSEIDSSGAGWVRFKSGLQICYGGATNTNGLGTGLTRFSFPKAFNAKPSVTVTANISARYTGMAFVEGSTSWVLNCIALYSSPPDYVVDAVLYNFIAIGTWK